MGELENSKTQIVKYRDTSSDAKGVEAVEVLMFEALVMFFLKKERSISFFSKLCALYIKKDKDFATPEGAKAGAMCGITLMQHNKFRNAASVLLKITPEYVFHLTEIAQPEDLASYIALSALASFSRSELNFLASSDQVFASFCEGAYQNFTQLIKWFLDSKYYEFIAALDEHTPDYQSDPFLFPIITKLLGLIKKRALLQYLSVYRNVSIKETTEAFHLSTSQLVNLIKIYVVEGTISALIDQKNGVSSFTCFSLADFVYSLCCWKVLYYMIELTIVLFF